MKIAIVTVNRSDYGLQKNLFKKLINSNYFKTKLIVTGAHLKKNFGNSIDEIKNDNIRIDYIINLNLNSKQKNITLLIKSFSLIIKKNKFDAVCLLGDRYETFAIAVSSFINNIPIIHIHGGEKTIGSIDDTYRHLISKMSSLHFVANKIYANRLKRLGEDPKKIFVVGGLGVDLIKSIRLLNKVNLLKKFNLKNKDIILCTVHPETKSDKYNSLLIINILKALQNFKNFNIVFTSSNDDPGNEIILQNIAKYISKNDNFYIFKSMGIKNYLSILKQAKIIIGNSSSGILEAPVLQTPTLNIGYRQVGREKGGSVFTIDPKHRDIINRLNQILKKKEIVYDHFYGKKGATDKIFKILKKQFNQNKITVYKEFYDKI